MLSILAYACATKEVQLTFTLEEICELLQISREEVERQRQKGYIRFVHRNGMTVYEITDILRLKNMLEMGGVYRKIDEKAFILEVAEKEKKKRNLQSDNKYETVGTCLAVQRVWCGRSCRRMNGMAQRLPL
ncbi:helix-turn-helix domain-containing protein [Bacteroides thetaiotaomicron]|nr:helix-turn-helix domain-containing protein [Bacteroides thetaiotaomicron]MCS3371548.1 helix-turn-helix domain-containing protein [Bacteroides thetaiotaomicron]UVP81919.1 helix-turn-helix domain-containing protein [Bacteroides caccae]